MAAKLNGTVWHFWVGLVITALTVISTGVYAAGKLSTEIQHTSQNVSKNAKETRINNDKARDNSQAIAVIKAQMHSLEVSIARMASKLDRLNEQIDKLVERDR